MMKRNSIATVALFALLAASASFADMTEERRSRTYQSAMADYLAGRLDAAIDGFEKAIEANGNNASARFQMACLLQDHRKDWLGAICSYREYLRLEGRSDKAPLAKERMAQCERELAAALADKYSIATSASQEKTNEQIQKALADTEKKVASTLKTLEDAQKRMAVLERENARLRRQLRSIGEDGGGASAPKDMVTARELLDGEDDDTAAAPARISNALRDEDDGAAAPNGIGGADVADDGKTGPSGRMNPAAFEPDDPSTGLRQGLADAKKLVKEDESGPELLQNGNNGEPGGRKLADFARHDDGKTKDRGDRPATYVVQDGDSLYRIARRFYGKESAWKAIRDANKAVISTDGRVKTGQTIVLP